MYSYVPLLYSILLYSIIFYYILFWEITSCIIKQKHMTTFVNYNHILFIACFTGGLHLGAQIIPMYDSHLRYIYIYIYIYV